MINADMPAMPTEATLNRIEGKFTEKSVNDNDYFLFGLTKREHFAGLAMQGLLSGEDGYNTMHAEIVNRSVQLADALLKELEK